MTRAAADTVLAVLTADGPVLVHVAGSVVAPGVYALDPDGRIQGAVDAAGGPTPSADLDGVTMVGREEGSATREALARACAGASSRPVIRLSLGSREAVREAVAAGLGVAAVLDGETGNDPRLVDRPLAGAADVRLVVACLAERRDHPPVRAFLDLAEAS